MGECGGLLGQHGVDAAGFELLADDIVGERGEAENLAAASDGGKEGAG